MGGTVSGLTVDGLVLINGNTTTNIVKDSTAFTMNGSVAYGSSYGISVFTQPTGLVCKVAPGTGIGTMGEADVTTVQVTCGPA